jgi:hypothetical protein
MDRYLSEKPNYWAYRTAQGRGIGDFLIIHRSIAQAPRPGWFIELKVPPGHKTTTSRAGRQLVATAIAQGADVMFVGPYHSLSGLPDEVWGPFMTGRIG